MNFCHNCGARLEDDNASCIECGLRLDENSPKDISPSLDGSESNDLNNNQGTIGFILAVISLLLPIPIIDTLIGVVALIFSLGGMKSETKGLAIAGLVVSVIAIIGSIVLYLEGGYDFF